MGEPRQHPSRRDGHRGSRRRTGTVGPSRDTDSAVAPADEVGARTVDDVHPYLRAWPTVDEAAKHLHEGRTVRVKHAVENGYLAVAVVSVDDYTPPVLSMVGFLRTHTGWRNNGHGSASGQMWSPDMTCYSRPVTSEVAVVVVRLGPDIQELRAENGWVLAVDKTPTAQDAAGYVSLGYVTVDGQAYVGEPPSPATDYDAVEPIYLTALSDSRHWVWAAQQQVERFVHAFRANAPGDRTGLPPTPEQRRRGSLIYTEAEFLLNAANHVLTALSRVPNGPKLSAALTSKIKQLRNLHEHWDEQRSAFAHRDLPKRKSGKSFAEAFPDAAPWSYGWGSGGHSISVLSLEELWAELDAVDRALARLTDAALEKSGIPHMVEGDAPAQPFPYVDPGPRTGSIVAMATLAQDIIIGDLPVRDRGQE